MSGAEFERARNQSLEAGKSFRLLAAKALAAAAVAASAVKLPYSWGDMGTLDVALLPETLDVGVVTVAATELDSLRFGSDF